MKTGIELIAEERREQVEKHGRTVQKDVEQNDFHQLKNAAIMLLGGYPHRDEYNKEPFNWDPQYWDRVTKKSYKDRLIIAGALIAAEIDRVNASSE